MKDIAKLVGTTNDDQIKWLMYFGALVELQPTFALAADQLVRGNQHDRLLGEKLHRAINLAKGGLDELYATVLRQLNEQQGE